MNDEKEMLPAVPSHLSRVGTSEDKNGKLAVVMLEFNTIFGLSRLALCLECAKALREGLRTVATQYPGTIS